MTPIDRFAAGAVGRLATSGANGEPHVVPITFVCDGTLIHTPIDHKPKSTTRLRRLANIEENPRASVIVDHYEDDWSALWWVRADGTATILTPGDAAHEEAAAALAAKYPDYGDTPVTGPIIEIRVARWATWAASESGSAAADD
jgi:PPOX class probable F420-dependent enzyme